MRPTNPRFTAVQITDNIYLGDLESSFNKEELVARNIGYVISIVNGVYESYPDDFKYKIIL